MPPSLFVLLLALVSLFLPATCQPLSLDDPRIAGGVIHSLDGTDWTASCPSLSLQLPATVPGDLITDLYNGRLIPEPMFDLNWLHNRSVWNDHTWLYTRNYSLSQLQYSALTNSSSSRDVSLVLDGIKMGANILLNDVLVYTALVQFERIVLSLRQLALNSSTSAAVREGVNRLSVVFDPQLLTQFYAMSTGGWDWAPLSNTTTADGQAATYSRGIWKSVYLVDSPAVTLTDISPLISYRGAYPVQPLVDGQHAGFSLNLTLFFTSTLPTAVTVTVSPSWAALPTLLKINLPAGDSVHSPVLDVPASEVQLWWPRGLGAQPLYDLNIRVERASFPAFAASRRVGFRFVALSTGNDTDEEYVRQSSGVDGTDTFGMKLRVNGAAVYARGANVVPMDTQEGRYSALAHQRLVQSAAEGQMNVLRIWGGGVYLPSIFYSTADEEGVMVMHDLMDRGWWHSTDAEISAFRHAVRRLSTHPAIVTWQGCNECDPTQNRIGTWLMGLVAQEDSSRPIWPSSPAPGGWVGGVHRLSSLPNGLPLIPHNLTFASIETHGPYQHGDGWPTVDGYFDALHAFDPQLPVPLDASQRQGLAFPNAYTSEFGSVGYSSFESMTGTLSPEHWSLHGGAPPANCSQGWWLAHCTPNNVMAQRKSVQRTAAPFPSIASLYSVSPVRLLTLCRSVSYPCDSIVVSYWGGQQSDLDAVGAAAFQRQLFQCIMGQALVLKSLIEEHRSTNAFGLQIWQLNEIWPTGGWGSLEWGRAESEGQVTGGRWKPSHYWLMESLFTPHIIACGINATGPPSPSSPLLCFVKNDVHLPSSGQVLISQVDLTGATPSTVLLSMPLTLPAGPGSTSFFSLPSPKDRTSVVLQAQYVSDDGRVLAFNLAYLAPPFQLQLQPVQLKAAVSAKPNMDGAFNVTVSKSGKGAAVFVTLTTRAEGRFNRNAFLMEGEQEVLTFQPWADNQHTRLVQSLRVEHAGMYQRGGANHGRRIDVSRE